MDTSLVPEIAKTMKIFNFRKDLEIFEYLGQRGYCSVFRGYNRPLKKFLVMKEFRFRNKRFENIQNELTDFLYESCLIKNLTAKYISNMIQFFGLWATSKTTITMLYESGSRSLHELLYFKKSLP